MAGLTLGLCFFPSVLAHRTVSTARFVPRLRRASYSKISALDADGSKPIKEGLTYNYKTCY